VVVAEIIMLVFARYMVRWLCDDVCEWLYDDACELLLRDWCL